MRIITTLKLLILTSSLIFLAYPNITSAQHSNPDRPIIVPPYPFPSLTPISPIPCQEDNCKITLPISPKQSCATAGCNGELCLDSKIASDINTICLWKPEYACLPHSRCEVQSNGQCGWTQTPKYQACMGDHQPSPDRPTPTPEPSLEQACHQSGGSFYMHQNSCVPTNCGYQPNPEQMCLMVITPACDCGPGKCWTGSKCDRLVHVDPQPFPTLKPIKPISDRPTQPISSPRKTVPTSTPPSPTTPVTPPHSPTPPTAPTTPPHPLSTPTPTLTPTPTPVIETKTPPLSPQRNWLRGLFEHLTTTLRNIFTR